MTGSAQISPKVFVSHASEDKERFVVEFATEMVACVNGSALGYTPRSLPCAQLGQVLAHVANGSLWLPNLRLTGR